MVGITRSGAHIPQGPKAPATSSTNTQIRVYADRALPSNIVANMTPQDFAELNKKGYLDCKLTSNTMESNEGFLTLSGKLAACLVGPSRSIGAIGIDPLFLEMIKDPNSKAGLGYTRVSNQTMEVLPSPAADPAVQQAERPRPAQHVQIPPLVNPNDPTPRPQQVAQTEPVQGVHPSSGATTVRTNFNNRDTTEMSTQQGTIQQTANSLNGFVDGRVIKVTKATVESSVLGGPMINGPDAEMRANGETAPIASELLTRAREILVNGQIQLPEGQKFKGDSHNQHQETLRSDFGVQVEFAANNRYLFAQDHKVVWAGEGEPSAQDQQFINAANNLFTAENVSVLRANENPLPQSAKTKIDNVVNSMNLPEGDQAALRQKLYDYAQSYVDARSATLSFEFNVETPEDRNQLQAWVTHLESQPGGVPENFKGTPEVPGAYEQAKNIIRNFDENGIGTGPEAISNAIGQNISNLDRPGVERSPAGEDGAVEIKEGTVEYMEQLIDQQVASLGAAGKSPSEVPMPAYQRVLNADGQEAIIKRPEAGQPLPEGFSAVESPLTDAVTLADWENKPDGQAGLLRQAVVGNASTPVLVDTLESVVTNAALLQSAQDNLGMLTQLVQDPENLNPETIDAFESKINEQIADLKERGLTAEATALEAGLQALNLPEVKTKAEASMEEKLAAKAIVDALDGGFLEQAGNSLDQFQDYVKSAVQDGKITYTERDDMRSFVSESMNGMRSFLESNGVVMTGDFPSSMFALDKSDLTSKGISPADADKALNMLERLKFAQSTVNVSSEGSAFGQLYESVHALNDRLEETEQIGGVKAHLQNDMQAAATDSPNAFDTMIVSTYNIPHTIGEDGKVQVSPENRLQLDSLRQKLLDKDLYPPVSGVNRSEMGGADSRFITPENGGPKIEIARDLLSDPDAVYKQTTIQIFNSLQNSSEVQAMAASRTLPETSALIADFEAVNTELENAQTELTALQTRFENMPENTPPEEFEGVYNELMAKDQEYQTLRPQLEQIGNDIRQMRSDLIDRHGGLTGQIQNTEREIQVAEKHLTEVQQATPPNAAIVATAQERLVEKQAHLSDLQTQKSDVETRLSSTNQTLGLNNNDFSVGAYDAPGNEGEAGFAALQQIQRGNTDAGAIRRTVGVASGRDPAPESSPTVRNEGRHVGDPTLDGRSRNPAVTRTQAMEEPYDRGIDANRSTRSDNIRANPAAEARVRQAFNLGANEPLPTQLPADATPAQREAWNEYAPLQAEYDTEQGFGAKIGSLLANGLPQGLQQFGLLLANHAEDMKAVIAKAFKDVASNLSNASTLMRAGDNIRGGSYVASQDADVNVGRSADYSRGQQNYASMMQGRGGGNPYTENSSGVPSYILEEEQAQEAERARQAQQQTQTA